jgi:hypothetical protein
MGRLSAGTGSRLPPSRIHTVQQARCGNGCYAVTKRLTVGDISASVRWPAARLRVCGLDSQAAQVRRKESCLAARRVPRLDYSGPR